MMDTPHPGGRPSQADCEGHSGTMMPSDGIIDSPWPLPPANIASGAYIDILVARFGHRASVVARRHWSR